MKKLIVLTAIVFAATQNILAQSYATTIIYNKVSEPGLSIELPYRQSICEGFIIDNLKKIGYDVETKGKFFWKQNKLNDFYTFKDVKLDGASQTVDLYFKVEQKSKRSPDESVISLLIGKGDNNFISSSDETTYFAAKQFLNHFVDQSASYKLDLDIKNHQDVIDKAEKKFNKLQNDEKNFLKKIDQLQKDVKRNQQDQQDQQKIIESEKKKLDDLKAQKKD